METMSLTPPFGPELVVTADERRVLESFLDFYRRIIVTKLHEVPDADAKRRLVPSETTLAGVLRHLAVVERNWFQHHLAGQPTPDEDADGGWSVEQTTMAELLEAYSRECARSRATAAGYRLDDTGTHDQLGPVSLRWIYVHMIDETARHAGHIDILRELTDGSTGAW
ncbi:DinB family protein [Micromonospora sp. NBC_01699]|uniref:DinB family protein n=1 Tax=Micromonospora sp. NBC_01699 TaxID=2975984 RepID=UPI002E290A1D|nr:DinB family protein [Micromonospora sp. NBC_01699]